MIGEVLVLRFFEGESLVSTELAPESPRIGETVFIRRRGEGGSRPYWSDEPLERYRVVDVHRTYEGEEDVQRKVDVMVERQDAAAVT